MKRYLIHRDSAGDSSGDGYRVGRDISIAKEIDVQLTNTMMNAATLVAVGMGAD
ncbi:hypothetical protein [Mycobacterium sp. 852002-51163_SCH5372311]|uniref:hypothetical protein n=1 Tax=Mycobacterium sp. 852002-51163_SCH5372311 TaxID=1834097 RepID=UPI000AA4F46F|nr:hypothetical protein [Mycobacterium sp. 852002-51163_SCH5372311]